MLIFKRAKHQWRCRASECNGSVAIWQSVIFQSRMLHASDLLVWMLNACGCEYRAQWQSERATFRWAPRTKCNLAFLPARRTLRNTMSRKNARSVKLYVCYMNITELHHMHSQKKITLCRCGAQERKASCCIGTRNIALLGVTDLAHK